MNPNNPNIDYSADDSPQDPVRSDYQSGGPVRSPAVPSEPVERVQSPAIPPAYNQGRAIEPVIPPRYVPPAVANQRPQNANPISVPPPSPTGVFGGRSTQVDAFGRPITQNQTATRPPAQAAPLYEPHHATPPANIPDNLHLIDTPGGQVSGNSQETLSPKPATLSLGPLFKKASKVMVFLGVIWAGAALLNAFVFQTYYVNGLSMLPTLNDSDRLVVSKVSKTQAAVTGGTLMPKRGEIIVIDSQVSTFTAARNEQIIKRVIGLPGERVTVEQGKVTIYNESSPKGFNPDSQLGLQLAPSHTTSPIDIEVPDDSVFVMGDNRAAGGSLDSRDFGPVRLDLIEGILWVRILPLDQVHIF